MLNKLSILLLFSILCAAGNAFAQTCKVYDDYIAMHYTGGCVNGIANGYGTAKGNNDYVGNFQNGLPHGNGTYIWTKRLIFGAGRGRKGDRFEGIFYEGQPKEGVYTFSNGDRYEGTFNIRPSGRLNLSENIFGEVRNRMQIGRFTPATTSQNKGKDYYFGEFNPPNASVQRQVVALSGFWEVGGTEGSDYYNRFSLRTVGARNENGAYIVRGYFENDVLKRECKNKIACTAHEWLPDERTGCTVRNYHAYSILAAPQPLQNVTWSGACKDGKAEGQGVVQFYWDGEPTEKFDGILSGGIIQQGKFYFKNGTVIREGRFVNDFLHGPGTITLENGEVISATFVYGSREGFVTKVDRSGKIVESGIYKNGKFILSCPSPTACSKLLAQQRASESQRNHNDPPATRGGSSSTQRIFNCSFLCRGSLFATGGRHSITVTAPDESSARDSAKGEAEKICKAEGRQRDGAWWADMSICDQK
ncbi:hypothetical protein [Lysobacter brunescens]|uniref:MORN repeat-containing protein n=1 Tax=Lysobacter brunescens TaxID=262323 RepID=A0ABW2Y7Z9_9GAMM